MKLQAKANLTPTLSKAKVGLMRPLSTSVERGKGGEVGYPALTGVR